MAHTPQLPMSVEAAKQNLRDAATSVSVRGYVRRHPYRALGIAFATGMLLADNRRAETILAGSRLFDSLRVLEK